MSLLNMLMDDEDFAPFFRVAERFAPVFNRARQRGRERSRGIRAEAPTRTPERYAKPTRMEAPRREPETYRKPVRAEAPVRAPERYTPPLRTVIGQGRTPEPTRTEFGIPREVLGGIADRKQITPNQAMQRPRLNQIPHMFNFGGLSARK